MTWQCDRADVTLMVILSISVLVANRSRGAEPPFLLPKEDDSVFRLEAFTSTSYFHFGKDGKYRRISRQHLFTCESDRGTWKQDATGRIELRSAVLVKELKSGPLRVPVRNIEQLEALRPLEKDIGAFLSADEKNSYSRREIERAWKYTYTWSLFESKVTFSAVEAAYFPENITKSHFRELLDAWKAYLKDDSKNRFYLVPVKHQNLVLLASDDYPFMANTQTPEKVREKADLFVERKVSPVFVYVLTGSDAALKEMKTRQPFIFYPELNRPESEEPLKYK